VPIFSVSATLRSSVTSETFDQSLRPFCTNSGTARWMFSSRKLQEHSALHLVPGLLGEPRLVVARKPCGGEGVYPVEVPQAGAVAVDHAPVVPRCLDVLPDPLVAGMGGDRHGGPVHDLVQPLDLDVPLDVLGDLLVRVVAAADLERRGRGGRAERREYLERAAVFAAVSQNSTLCSPFTLENSCDPSEVHVLPSGMTSAASHSGREEGALDVLVRLAEAGTAKRPFASKTFVQVPFHAPAGPTQAIRLPRTTMSSFSSHESVNTLRTVAPRMMRSAGSLPSATCTSICRVFVSSLNAMGCVTRVAVGTSSAASEMAPAARRANKALADLHPWPGGAIPGAARL
jgi:hypothetical protein